MSSHDGKLVMMANQIGKFFAPQKTVDPVAGIADHLEKFWDPRMRSAIIEATLRQSREARLEILRSMLSAIRLFAALHG